MAKKVYIDFELKYKEAVKNLDEIQSEYSKLEKQVDKTSDSQKELGGILDSTTGGAITKFKDLKGTLGTVIKSFKSLKVAVMATGIGLLVVAVGSLTAMFTSSEKGQNRFTKILMQIGVVAGNVIDILSDLGSVVFNVFTGNFKAAGEAISEVIEGVKDFGEETKKEIKIAGELADMRAKADKVERQLLIDRAEATRKFNELREKAADKENVSVDERIRLLKEAGAIEEEITIKEIEAARLRFEAKRQQNLLSKSTKQDLDEQAQLEARLIELEASRLKKQKTLTAEITTNLREAASERKVIASEFEKDYVFHPIYGLISKVAIDKAKKESEAIKKIQNDFKKKEQDELAITNEEKLELEKNRKLAELDALNATEAQKADIILYYNNKITQAKEKAEDQEAKLKKIRTQQELVDAQNTFNQIAQLAGKDSKIGKAMAIASATISGVRGVQNAYTTAQDSKITAVFPAYPVLQAALAGAFALQNIAAIKRINPSGEGGANISRPSASSASAPPAFNVVGASGTNQLAETIAGQQQQPVQAYVVSNDVTTAQELDRNIITGASIG